MKKIFLVLILISAAFTGMAQVTSVTEDFNVSCINVGPNYPPFWSQWNIIPPLSPLAWNCAPLSGRDGTPGMQCNGYYSGVYYLDTAWLFTPQLDLTHYDNDVYIKFDSRYEHSAAKLSVMVSTNYNKYRDPDSPIVWNDLTSALTPIFTPDDSLGWVTHWADLTPYKSVPLYVAFRYTSTTSAAGAWTLDNIMTTPFSMNVTTVQKQNVPLTILGNSSSSQIMFSYNTYAAGNYDVVLYDNIGREVYKGTISSRGGSQVYTLSNLSLHPGMYVLKMGNHEGYGTVKTIVE